MRLAAAKAAAPVANSASAPGTGIGSGSTGMIESGTVKNASPIGPEIVDPGLTPTLAIEHGTIEASPVQTA